MTPTCAYIVIPNDRGHGAVLALANRILDASDELVAYCRANGYAEITQTADDILAAVALQLAAE